MKFRDIIRLPPREFLFRLKCRLRHETTIRIRTLYDRICCYTMRYFWDGENLLHKTTGISRGTFLNNTVWGKFSGCGTGCSIANTVLGNYVLISWNVAIGVRSHAYSNFSCFDHFIGDVIIPKEKKKFGQYSVKIGHDVWIGCNAVILPGVSVGNGAIIAAGAIVTKSVPEYAIVAGNPARFIKWRFSIENMEKIKDSRWWELEPDEVMRRHKEFQKMVGFDYQKYQDDLVQRQERFVECNERS